MKNKTIILTVFVGWMLSACSDFLDRMPLTQPNNETFLSNRANVESYINSLYTSLPTPSQYGIGIRGEEVNSDNILSESYNARLNGENNESSGTSEWETGYENLRKANYFFHYYAIPESDETDDVKSLRGEAYFFRAYWHFYLLTRFGNIPIMNDFWDENATIAGLQIPASKRADVARFILNDLKAAIGLVPAVRANLLPRSKYAGLRVNRETAIILAMRVALYEGSWEKYHKGTNFAIEDNSAEFFQEVLNWGDQQLFPANLTLNTMATDKIAKNAEDAFQHLFNSKDLSDIQEVVLWKKYSLADGVFQAVNGLLADGIVDNAAPSGLSKSLVDNYLNADGTFIDPNDPKYKNFNAMFKGRDARLHATVMHSGAKFKSGKMMNVKEYNVTDTTSLSESVKKEIKQYNKSISTPGLNSDGKYKNVTGFHIRLGIDTTYVSGNSETAHVLFRYAEGLLCYAEAAAELGKYDEAVAGKTLKLLRERAGVKYIAPTADPNFQFVGLSPEVQEVRRERRSELALQGFRLDDLMRWREASTLKGVKGRGRGAYLGEDGVLYKSFLRGELNENKVWEVKSSLSNNKILVDENGWMDPLLQYLPNGYLFNENRDYLLPIPSTDVLSNHELKQNPGWE